MIMAVKKLIEVALPLEKINEASAREKSIRHGHPSTLHLWWARRPLAAARAVIWASLVDDPSSHPELFLTEEDQNKERQRLFKILEDLVVWENSNNETVLNRAKTEIMKYTNNKPPALLDPFAGGGAIPLEAQRLGLVAYAHDLNPVAVMINKAMIEIPPRFANVAPVNPDSRELCDTGWSGASGLAEDIRYYGELLKKEAFKRIGHLYPKVCVPQSKGGGDATVIAWIWARTVKCPNPNCGHIVPLTSSFVLSKKKSNLAWIKPLTSDYLHFTIIDGLYDKALENGTKKGKKAVFACPCCGEGIVNGDYIDNEAKYGRMDSIPLAVVAEGKSGRLYLAPDKEQLTLTERDVENYYKSHNIEEKVSHAACRGTFASNAQGRRYGFNEFCDYFTRRQLVELSTFSELVQEIQNKVERDAIRSGLPNDHISLQDNGNGALAYGQSIGVYLSFLIDKLADYHSAVSSWNSAGEKMRNTFGRQAIPMVWDYAECNPFCSSSGSFDNMLTWVYKSVAQFSSSIPGAAKQMDAQKDCGLSEIMISTDPPYYDNIDYSDLSDFFYVWLRQSLRGTFPDLFRTLLTPKAEELIATPYRHEGDSDKAKEFFESGMLKTCRQLYKYTRSDIPVTVYYAYKQNDSDTVDETVSSSGWETMLTAIIQAGFAITGTWPMRTELSVRQIATGTNALASSIVLVCRKREETAPICTRRIFINELKRELRPALQKLQNSNIAPVDLAQSAIGPGMGVYSKYAQVLEADGTPMSVRNALKIINQELDLYLNEQDSELDSESRFCIDLYSQFAFNEMAYGDALTLATAKNTSMEAMATEGTLYARRGKVHLLERAELPDRIDIHGENIWLLCQQLTYKMETEGIEGCAKAVAPMVGSNAERAKDLAYRLYTIAEKKKWTQEAYAYNALVVSWPEIQSRASELKSVQPEQITLIDYHD